MHRRIIMYAFILVVLYGQNSPCDDQISKREFVGKLPLTHALYISAEQSSGLISPDSTFNIEEFRYIGKVSVKNGPEWLICTLATVWGPECYYELLLLIFDQNGFYLGHYSNFIDSEISITDNVVVFPYSFVEGNRIEFGYDGPPDSTKIGGRIIQYKKI